MSQHILTKHKPGNTIESAVRRVTVVILSAALNSIQTYSANLKYNSNVYYLKIVYGNEAGNKMNYEINLENNFRYAIIQFRYVNCVIKLTY